MVGPTNFHPLFLRSLDRAIDASVVAGMCPFSCGGVCAEGLKDQK